MLLWITIFNDKKKFVKFRPVGTFDKPKTIALNFQKRLIKISKEKDPASYIYGVVRPGGHIGRTGRFTLFYLRLGLYNTSSQRGWLTSVGYGGIAL